MIHLIRAEIIKFRSVRSTVVLLVAAGALVVLVAALQVRDIEANERLSRQLGDLTGGVTLAVFLFGALGVQVIGQEYRFNTIRTTLAAAPTRWKVLLAKLVVVTVACAVMALMGVAACAVIGDRFLDGFQIDEIDHRLIWATALFASGWSAMGLGLGAIVRQPIAGILLLLGEAFVAEPLIGTLFPGTAPWLPFANGVQMTTRDGAGGGGPDGEAVYRSILAGGVYFFVITAVVLAVGTYLASRRDA